MHPILRPGSHVLRRGDGDLQIGLDPGRAIVLPADEGVRTCLKRLTASADATEFTGRRDAEVLELLVAHDLVVDADRLLPLIPFRGKEPRGSQPRGRDDRGREDRGRERGQPSPARSEVAALSRTAGDDAARLVHARGRAVVELAPFGNESAPALGSELERLLTGAGIRIRPAHTSPTSPTSSSSSSSSSSVAVLFGVGEPHREQTDRWLRDGLPHVVVRLSEGYATVGPFVEPGESACLRCLDAHHTDADSSWPLLVEQFASLSSQGRTDGVPEPLDSLVASVALAWAARDVTSYAEGCTPSTWSTTVRFDPRLSSIETRSWLRHPECGCSWG